MAGESDIVIQATFKYTEEGAEEVVAANQAVEKSAQDMTQNTQQASSGIAEVGTASEKAGEEAATAATGISAVGKESETTAAAAKNAGKGAEDAGGGFNLLSMRGMMSAMMFVQFAQMAGQAVAAMAQVDEAAQHTAGAFTQLMGSSDKANQELATLNSTWAAAKFGTQAIDNVAQHLLMGGEDAQTAQKEIERVSDAVAAMGGSAQQIEPVIDKLHSMQQEGAITDQDMQTLAKDGVASYQALAEGLTVLRGHTVSEAEAMQEVKDHAISGDEAYKAMMTGMMQYTDAAKNQSSDLSAEWTRLGRNASQAFQPVIDDLAKILDGINKILEGSASLGDVFQMLKGMAGIGLGLVGLPGFAEGGTNLPAGLRVVGENGPEIQWSPGGDTIFPSSTSLADVLSGTGALSGSGSSLPSLASLFGGGAGGGGIGQPITVVANFNVSGRQMAQATIPFIAPMVRGLTGGKM